MKHERRLCNGQEADFKRWHDTAGCTGDKSRGSGIRPCLECGKNNRQSARIRLSFSGVLMNAVPVDGDHARRFRLLEQGGSGMDQVRTLVLRIAGGDARAADRGEPLAGEKAAQGGKFEASYLGRRGRCHRVVVPVLACRLHHSR